MRNLLSLFVFALTVTASSQAFAVGTCNSSLRGPSSTPCCATTNMAGGGTCYVPADTKFQFTIKSFGFENSIGTVTPLGTETAFNAASADAGNVIGNFVSGGALTTGTYVAVHPSIRLNNTVVNNTAVTTPDGLTCRAGETTSTFPSGGAPVCGAGEPNGSVQNCLQAADNNIMEIFDNSLGTIAYNGTSALNISFTFNTGNGVECTFAGGAIPGDNETSKAAGILDVTMALQ
jgi:hypothetical protein